MLKRVLAFALALAPLALSAQHKPTLIVNPFTTGQGVELPYDLKQLHGQLVAELRVMLGKEFTVVAEAPTTPTGKVFTLGGEIVAWRPGNAAKRLLVGMGSGREASDIAYTVTDASGAKVVDKSAAFRMEPDVPLVIAEVNPDDLRDMPRGIVSSPNCTTTVPLLALAPLHRAAGIRRMVVSSYQSVSGAGQPGMRELDEQWTKGTGQAERVASFVEQYGKQVDISRGQAGGRRAIEKHVARPASGHGAVRDGVGDHARRGRCQRMARNRHSRAGGEAARPDARDLGHRGRRHAGWRAQRRRLSPAVRRPW